MQAYVKLLTLFTLTAVAAFVAWLGKRDRTGSARHP